MKNVSFILLLAMAVLFVSSCEKGKEDPLPTHGVMLYKKILNIVFYAIKGQHTLVKIVILVIRIHCMRIHTH